MEVPAIRDRDVFPRWGLVGDFECVELDATELEPVFAAVAEPQIAVSDDEASRIRGDLRGIDRRKRRGWHPWTCRIGR